MPSSYPSLVSLVSFVLPLSAAPKVSTGTALEEEGQLKTGRLIDLGIVPSRHVAARKVQVWLPPGYQDSTERYPVIYMHDGQNVFDRTRSYGGHEWQVDETMGQMIFEGSIPPAIVVAIDNAGRDRWLEYAPEKVVQSWRTAYADQLRDAGPGFLFLAGEQDLSSLTLKGDAYLRFLVEELKPLMDRNYRTKSDPEDTMLAGSSMGGLISLYGLAEYPKVFGRAACVSIHWPVGHPSYAIAATSIEFMQAYLGSSQLEPATQRIWFDRGTETLDAYYEPYAEQMQEWFTSHYPEAGENVLFKVYPGTEHSEKAWAARFGEIARFLLTEGEPVSQVRSHHPD